MDLFKKQGIIGWNPLWQAPLYGVIEAGLIPCMTGIPGSCKTRFCTSYAELRGLKHRIFQADKTGPDTLTGNISPEFVTLTPTYLNRIYEAILAASNRIELDEKELSKHKKVVMSSDEMFIDGVTDYEVIIVDEFLRGDKIQQGYWLDIMEERRHLGRPVKGKIMVCTNTNFEELHDFNEAALSRFAVVMPCPRFLDMPDDDQDLLISESGHNKVSRILTYDEEYDKLLAKLSEQLKQRPSAIIDNNVKQFMRHLKYPLGKILENRFSGRSVDNISRVLYISLYAHCSLNKLKFDEIKRTDLRDLMFETFKLTMYLGDLNKKEVSQVQNAFYHAFLHTFDVKKLTLKNRIESVPSFLANAEDFAAHIKSHQTEEQDIAGISIFIRKMKNECTNNEPLRYILYKWFIHKAEKFGVKMTADDLETVQSKYESMQNKMNRHMQSKSEITETSAMLSPNFLQTIQEQQGDKIFSCIEKDSNLYEALITIISCFDPEGELVNEEYVNKMYVKLAQLQNI